MSRFLDQIRKAKEARERAARMAAEAEQQAGEAEEQSLVPEREDRPQSDTPSDAQAKSGQTEESAEHETDASLFPETPDHEASKAPVEEEETAQANIDEDDGTLIPEELAEKRERQAATQAHEPAEEIQQDLVPEMREDQRPQPPIPPPKPDLSNLVPEREKKEVPESETHQEAELEIEVEEPEELVPEELAEKQAFHEKEQAVFLEEEEQDEELVPSDLAEARPETEEKPQFVDEDEDLFAMAERELEEEMDALETKIPEPNLEQEWPTPEEMESLAKRQRQEEAERGKEKLAQKAAEEKKQLQEEQEDESPSEAVVAGTEKREGKEGLQAAAKSEEMVKDKEKEDVEESETPAETPAVESPLFPSELSNRRPSASPRPRPKVLTKASVATMEQDQPEEKETEDVYSSSEQYEPTFSRRPSRSRRRRSRGEIPVPGPEIDQQFLQRLPQIQLRPDKRIQAYYDPQNHVCEEYRLLGKNLLHTFASTQGEQDTGKAVVLTSSTRGEGKTLTSVNLAMVLAQDISDRVLLIDCDLRHPKVHRYMGLQPHSGLNDMLAAEDPEAVIEDCVQRSEMGLHLLCATPHGSNPAPLLDNPRMNKVLNTLRKHYSIIIIDTPPVLLATDALTIGVKSDGMLFLLRARKTQREQIQEARQRIARLEIRMLGYVINNVKSFLPQVWRKYYYGNY